jgi:hypothetical protein
VPYFQNTTWTIGRILDRLQEAEEEVVVYAGHHAHQGVIRAIGEFLLTLQDGDDMVAVKLETISSVRRVRAGQRRDASLPQAAPPHLGG